MLSFSIYDTQVTSPGWVMWAIFKKLDFKNKLDTILLIHCLLNMFLRKLYGYLEHSLDQEEEWQYANGGGVGTSLGPGYKQLKNILED